MPAETTESSAPPPHIVIGTPCYGGNVTQHYMISMIKLYAACSGRNIDLSFRLLGGDALVTTTWHTGPWSVKVREGGDDLFREPVERPGG